MGNRDALLRGAKRCLLALGFAQTTARDIASAAGVSLAAIGYHFGTTQNLMTAALMSALLELDADFNRIASRRDDPGASPAKRFEARWSRLIASIEKHRELWAINFEVFAQIERNPALRRLIDEGLLERAREGLVAMFQDIDERQVGARTRRTLGAVYYALLAGVMVQWIVDPDHAPSARELVDGLRAIAADLAPREPSRRKRPPSLQGGDSRHNRR